MNKKILFSLTALVAGLAQAESWQRIDFDADLTTYLVSKERISREGNVAALWELNVPGRTSISTGQQNHTLVERLFDCEAKTQKIGEVLMFSWLGADAEPLPHADISYAMQPGSIDEIEMKLACDGIQPAENVYTSQNYSSIDEAITRAFADAVKLPREQSNKTLKGLGPMGPPSSADGTSR